MTNIIAEYYLESHITIEPVFDERLEQIKVIAEKFGFKVAESRKAGRLVLEL